MKEAVDGLFFTIAEIIAQHIYNARKLFEKKYFQEEVS